MTMMIETVMRHERLTPGPRVSSTASVSRAARGQLYLASTAGAAASSRARVASSNSSDSSARVDRRRDRSRGT